MKRFADPARLALLGASMAFVLGQKPSVGVGARRVLMQPKEPPAPKLSRQERRFLERQDAKKRK